MKRFASIVSFLLSPLFTLLPIPFILVSRFTQDYSYAFKWTIFSYAFILIVVLFVVIGVFFGFFSNFDVSKRKQRPLLFSFSASTIFIYFLSLLVLDGPRVLFIALFAIALGLVVMVFVNKWIKASIHLAAAASVVLFAAIVYGKYFFLLLLLIPLLAWARVKTKEHTLMETIVGTLLGLVLTSIVYIVSRQFLLEMFGVIYN